MSRVRAGSAVLVVLLSGAACSDGDQPTAAPDRAELVAHGAEVYARSCASCHGEDLTGTDRGPSHLSVVYEPNHHPDAAFRSAIENGSSQHHWDFGPMPPVEGLDDRDVDAVIAFVRAEQDRRGFEAPGPGHHR
jgi:mono/diheme cytochrome c family protein